MPRLAPMLFLLVMLHPWIAVAEPAAAESKDEKPAAAPADPKAELRVAIDKYLDQRWLPEAEAAKATDELVAKLDAAGCGIEEVEKMLRAGRAHYGEAKTKGKLALVQGLTCDHVDYKPRFFVYIPNGYDPAKPAPLLLIGHGGNGAMDADYAMKASLSGTIPWLQSKVIDEKNFIIAAPLSERGWGAIGNSILLTVISWVQRQLNVDPDRIYVTGHSMGGHLSWRSGIYLGDRWGAVAPMSGGYDYVDDKQVYTLVDVPGYTTFGAKEPYNINDYNKKIRGWMEEHHFDWKLIEKEGGHEIFVDELPKVADFLLAHPRDPYRKRVYGLAGGSVVYNNPEKNEKWGQEHTWNADRPIQRSTFHWLRMVELPKDTPKEKHPSRIWAENLGENRIQLTSQFARHARLYLHPKMVDFSKPIKVAANGKLVFSEKVPPSLKTMLELVREFDDRGRVFHAVIDVDIPTDADETPVPQGDAPPAKEVPKAAESVSLDERR